MHDRRSHVLRSVFLGRDGEEEIVVLGKVSASSESDIFPLSEQCRCTFCVLLYVCVVFESDSFLHRRENTASLSGSGECP